MTSLDLEYAKRQFRALPDEELRRILDSGADEYTPDALVLVREEIDRRALEPRSDAPPNVATEPDRRRADVWIDVYAALMISWAAVGVITGVILGIGGSALEPFFVVHVVTAYGLLKRRTWAWFLNFPLLFLSLIMPPASQSAFMALGRIVWLIGNAVYFVRVRKKFSFGLAPRAGRAP